MYADMELCTCEYMHACVCACMYARMYEIMHAFSYAQMRMPTCLHTCIYIVHVQLGVLSSTPRDNVLTYIWNASTLEFMKFMDGLFPSYGNTLETNTFKYT